MFDELRTLVIAYCELDKKVYVEDITMFVMFVNEVMQVLLERCWM